MSAGQLYELRVDCVVVTCLCCNRCHISNSGDSEVVDGSSPGTDEAVPDPGTTINTIPGDEAITDVPWTLAPSDTLSPTRTTDPSDENTATSPPGNTETSVPSDAVIIPTQTSAPSTETIEETEEDRKDNIHASTGTPATPKEDSAPPLPGDTGTSVPSATSASTRTSSGSAALIAIWRGTRRVVGCACVVASLSFLV